jgi:hypothetical protein
MPVRCWRTPAAPFVAAPFWAALAPFRSAPRSAWPSARGLFRAHFVHAAGARSAAITSSPVRSVVA